MFAEAIILTVFFGAVFLLSVWLGLYILNWLRKKLTEMFK